MKQRRKICTTLLASSLILLFGIAVPAEELLPNDSIDAATGYYEEPAVIDREATIEELVRQWGTDAHTAYQLRATLEHASDEKLTEVWDAESLDEIDGILRGKALDGPLSLGDTDQDYVYTPVTPCRIVDTRKAVGMMTANTTREFDVWGGASWMIAQGGNPAGCPSPVSEPRGVHINITAVEQISSGGGHLRAYPANVTKPDASILNFMNGQNAIANAASVKTFYSVSAKELEIFASANTHVVIDVLGYYERPGRTTLDVYTTSASVSIPAGALGSAFSPVCASGYRVMGGGCTIQNDDRLHATRPSPTSGTPTRWECRIRNYLGVSQNLTAYVICARVPGR